MRVVCLPSLWREVGGRYCHTMSSQSPIKPNFSPGWCLLGNLSTPTRPDRQDRRADSRVTPGDRVTLQRLISKLCCPECPLSRDQTRPEFLTWNKNGVRCHQPSSQPSNLRRSPLTAHIEWTGLSLVVTRGAVAFLSPLTLWKTFFLWSNMGTLRQSSKVFVLISDIICSNQAEALHWVDWVTQSGDL